LIWIKLRCTRGNWPRFSLIEQGIAERRCPISTSPVPPTTPARCCLGATAPSQHGAIRSCTGSPNARPMATQSQKTMQGDKRTLSAIAAGLMTGGGGQSDRRRGGDLRRHLHQPLPRVLYPQPLKRSSALKRGNERRLSVAHAPKERLEGPVNALVRHLRFRGAHVSSSRRRAAELATLRGEPEGQALVGPGLAALLEHGVVQLLVESQGLRHRRLLPGRRIETVGDRAVHASDTVSGRSDTARALTSSITSPLPLGSSAKVPSPLPQHRDARRSCAPPLVAFASAGAASSESSMRAMTTSPAAALHPAVKPLVGEQPQDRLVPSAPPRPRQGAAAACSPPGVLEPVL